MPHLSIVIPAYNEQNRIGRTLTETFDYLERQNYSSEVILVNDGSTDHTVEAVRKFESRAGGRLRLVENPGNRGKGYSVRNGMLNAAGDIALFYDADLATPTSEIVKVVEPIAEDRYDVVFGSRALDRSLIGTRQSRFRETLGWAANWVQFAFTGLRFKDTQCGFKAFRRDTAQSVFRLQRIEGFGFDPEILFIAKKQGWRLLETSVLWNHIEGSKLNPMTAYFNALMEVSTIRWNNLLGKYDEQTKRQY
ncbi:MAG TPA: dolichyl-phosphate beta-glucosyltransferase [Blastocatellia bacterium]|jgi:glycosyltransferase involved in cell wall biosynthesis|nr:dolichyl-phosphate beta-glucosyltransferase [Blastocatellia bacterium]